MALPIQPEAWRAAVASIPLLFALSTDALSQGVQSIPFRDPAQLEQWLALDDARYNALLQTNWQAVQSVLEEHVPAGLALTSVSHGFAGPQRSCLLDQAPLACRIYMRDLAKINRARQASAGTMANPFAQR